MKALVFVFVLVDEQAITISNLLSQFQICTNKVGSYECGCREGFSLSSNNHTCQPDGGPEIALAGHTMPSEVLEQGKVI